MSIKRTKIVLNDCLLCWWSVYLYVHQLLFTEGCLQSTAYSCIHEIREQAPPETGKVLHNRDFTPNTRLLPFPISALAFFGIHVLWKSCEKWFETLNFIMKSLWSGCRGCCPLEFTVVAVLPCAYWSYAPVMEAESPCRYSVHDYIDQVSRSACLCEYVLISWYYLVLCFVKPCRCLLVERDAVRPNSPLTDRLMLKALALHD